MQQTFFLSLLLKYLEISKQLRPFDYNISISSLKYQMARFVTNLKKFIKRLKAEILKLP